MAERLRAIPRERVQAGLVALVAVLAVLPFVVRRVGDPDFWWHLRTAEWIVANHRLPSHDLYTYTATGHPWLDQEWASELVLYALYRLGGMALVSVGFGLVILAGFWFIYRRIRLERAAPGIAAAALVLGALAGAGVWSPRPQMVTFAFLCLILYYLEGYLRGRYQSLYLLPLAVAVWANFHAGAILGVAFVGLALVVELARWLAGAGERRRSVLHLAVVLVLCAVAMLLTPAGPGLYAYIFKTQFSPVQQSLITEWQTPDFHHLNMVGLALAILAVLPGLAFRRPPLWDAALLVVGVGVALLAVRNIPFFVAAVTPILAWSYGRAWEELAVHRDVRGLLAREAELVTALLVLVALIGLGGNGLLMERNFRSEAAFVAANYPAGAADWLAAHPGSGHRMFNPFDWGGYLAYRFYPDPNRRVFAFGEAIVMGDRLMAQVADVEGGNPDWESIFAQHHVDLVLERSDSPMAAALEVDPQWRREYDDGFAVIFLKVGSG